MYSIKDYSCVSVCACAIKCSSFVKLLFFSGPRVINHVWPSTPHSAHEWNLSIIVTLVPSSAAAIVGWPRPQTCLSSSQENNTSAWFGSVHQFGLGPKSDINHLQRLCECSEVFGRCVISEKVETDEKRVHLHWDRIKMGTPGDEC